MMLDHRTAAVSIIDNNDFVGFTERLSCGSDGRQGRPQQKFLVVRRNDK